MRKIGNITEDGVRDLVSFHCVSGIYFKERFGFFLLFPSVFLWDGDRFFSFVLLFFCISYPTGSS